MREFMRLVLFFGLLLSNRAFSQSADVAAKHSVSSYENIYIGADLSTQELSEFKKKEGAVVIDLREMKELGSCGQAVEATKLGLQYQMVSFSREGAISPKVIADIDALVEKAGSQPVLVFCKSASRAASWLAIHLATKKKMSQERALAIARKNGLQPGSEVRVRNYLSKMAQ